jgi:hypothetical protein
MRFLFIITAIVSSIACQAPEKKNDKAPPKMEQAAKSEPAPKVEPTTKPEATSKAQKQLSPKSLPTTLATEKVGSTCPKAIYSNQLGQDCSFPDVTKTCTYPEGTCSCRLPPYCAGGTPKPKLPTSTVFSCDFTDPAVVRSDGCFVLIPSGPCAKEGQECEYRSCGQVSVRALCQNGTWNRTDYELKKRP